ncbi:sensor histidine kinase [Ulvibacterium sp.]|uniref:sensor histidine kinase n=1 Tax=Ulvibacterium sp. TaxID=2665914 RepID=UPI003CC50BDF
MDRIDLEPSIPMDLKGKPSAPPSGAPVPMDLRGNPSAPPPEPPSTISIFNVRDTFVIQFTMVILLSFLLRLDDRVKEIKNEKLKAEVNYLKAQINPHFLFNTLNSIYALTLKKSEKAPNAVLKLSEIMRYVVTQSDSEKVPLAHEIQYIVDYIELQKLRIGKNVEVNFKVNGLPESKSITPIILVNYIENAFKYGVNPDKPSKINILISMDENGVELQVDNKITVQQSSFLESTEGGNLNTKRRLDYFYPGKHELEIDHSPPHHSVKLYIELV